MGLSKELMLRYQEMEKFTEEIKITFGKKNIMVIENESITINIKDYLNFNV